MRRKMSKTGSIKDRNTKGSQEEKLKAMIKEAVAETLLDSGVLAKVIETVTEHALKRQQKLLEEALDIIEEDMDNLTESIDDKLSDHMERVEGRIVESLEVGAGMVGSGDVDSIHRDFANNARGTYSESVPVQESSDLSLRQSRRGGRRQPQSRTPKSQIAKNLQSGLGIDIFEGVDPNRVMENHMSGEEAEQACGTSYDDSILSQGPQSYSVSADDLNDFLG